MYRHFFTAGLIVALASAVFFYTYGRGLWVPVYLKFAGRQTVAEAVERFRSNAESRLLPRFAAANISYPPDNVTLLATKEDGLLELWAAADGEEYRHIHTYPVLKTSGRAGPKLMEGDKQVPEGRYNIISLNPNSAYHLSMQLDYPNQFDLLHASAENRTEPGSNIFIHGKAVSVGCLAMGDKAIEELFVLAATIGIENLQVVIAPRDPRKQQLTPVNDTEPGWVADLYKQIEREFLKHPL